MLYISETVDRIIKIIYKYFFVFLQKSDIVNIKMILFFLLTYFNSFFNSYLFFRFINKCKKEILRGAPPSSHVCDFLKKSFCPKNGENEPKMSQKQGFLNLLEDLVINFFWIWFIKKLCNIYCILAQTPYLGKIWFLR